MSRQTKAELQNELEDACYELGKVRHEVRLLTADMRRLKKRVREKEANMEWNRAVAVGRAEAYKDSGELLREIRD